MNPEEKQQKILDILTEELTCSRFTLFTLTKAANEIGVTGAELELLFDGGLPQVAEMLFERHQNELEHKIKEMPKEGITSNIKRSVLLSFNLLAQKKKALLQVIRFLSLPQNAFYLPKMLYKEVDLIWRANGINDSSFKFYTKRLSLGSIYAVCFAYFILSKNHEKLEGLLEKQLSGLKFLTSKFNF